ncbi:uncharacterized protein LOC114249314 [Bombyx mandarina]|uniref:Uncharacterized protein n=2 Tax=Bombyx TaxID=7090 RepID=A0A8R2AEK6_BOMMO|nr:uncharacterized protein LOC101746743 [Bombyx mori]XP_028038637.1 uncharacterized protein LOC114249314 [Bombyx mandarina]
MSDTNNNHNVDASCNKTNTVKEKWPVQLSLCRASTSRGLSHSSGDYDGSENCSVSDRCSCESVKYNKPFLIVDSSTVLHKSKWSTFKNYLKRNIQRNKIFHKEKKSRNAVYEQSEKDLK